MQLSEHICNGSGILPLKLIGGNTLQHGKQRGLLCLTSLAVYVLNSMNVHCTVITITIM